MGVDHTNVASGAGRASVRITSKKSYNHGLIILDLGHMPGGICGTWPALYVIPESFRASFDKTQLVSRPQLAERRRNRYH